MSLLKTATSVEYVFSFYLPLLLGHLLDDINDDVVINSSDIQHHWSQYSNEPNNKATLLLKW